MFLPKHRLFCKFSVCRVSRVSARPHGWWTLTLRPERRELLLHDASTRAVGLQIIEPKAARAVALNRLRDEIFVGSLESYRSNLTFDEDPCGQSPSDLADMSVFRELLARFRNQVGGSDDRSLVSFWSQHYFAGLLLPFTAFCLLAGTDIPLDARTMRVSFCPIKGTPRQFHFSPAASARPAPVLLEAILHEQVAPMVALLKRHGGLSARLFWENAGCYLAWILGEIAQTHPGSRATAMALLGDTQWTRTAGPAIEHLKCATLKGEVAARRLCCLRYGVPGYARCPGTCPLAES